MRLVGLRLRGGPRAPPCRLPTVVVPRVLLAGRLAFWTGVWPPLPGPLGLALWDPSLAWPNGPLAGSAVRALGFRARAGAAVV